MKKILVLTLFVALLTVLIVLPPDVSAAPSISITPSFADPGQMVSLTGSGFSSSDSGVTIQNGNGFILIPVVDTPCLVDHGQLVTVASGNEVFSCSYFAFPSHNGAQAQQGFEVKGNTGDVASDDLFGVRGGIAAYPPQGSIGTTVTLYGSGYIGDLVVKGIPIGDQDLRVYFNNNLVTEGLEPSFKLVTPGSTSDCYPSQGSLDDIGPCTFPVPIVDPGTYTITATAYSSGLQTKSYSTTFTVLAPSLSSSNQEPAKSSTITLTGTNFSGIDTSGKIYWRGADITPSSGCPFTTSTTGSSFSCQIQVPSSDLASAGPNGIAVVGSPFGDDASTYVDIHGPYPLSISSSQATIGSTITVSGQAFDPSDTSVTLTVNSQPGNTGPTCPVTNGAFSCPFTIPSSAQTGNTEIFAQGNNAADYDFAGITVGSGISLSQPSATVGAIGQINGAGFSFGNTVTLKIDGQSLPFTDLSSGGFFGNAPSQQDPVCHVGGIFFSCNFIVPPTFSGLHIITITDNQGNSATTTLQINPSVSVAPSLSQFGVPSTSNLFMLQNQVVPKTIDSASAFGLSASETFAHIRFDGLFVGVGDGCPVVSGSYTCPFIVPPLPPGSYPLEAIDNNGNSISAQTITITSPLTGVLGTLQFPTGSVVTVNAFGLSSSDTLATLFFNSQSTGTICPVVGDSATCSFTIPSVSPGTYNIGVAGNTGDIAKITIDVLPAISVSPQSAPIGTPTSISFTGSGFSSTDTSAKISLGSIVLGSCPVTSGSISCSSPFTVPSSLPASVYAVTAVGNTLGDTALTTFGLAGVIFTPSVAIAGSNNIELSQSGFSPYDKSLSVVFNGQNIQTCSNVGAIFNGIASDPSSCEFTVPQTSAGSYQVKVQGTTGDFADTSFTIPTPDIIPPVIAPIPDQTVEATSPAGAVGTYTATATDNIDGTDAVTCSPSSGSIFALGSTTVTCNSQDAVGNAATPVTFTITIQDTTPPVLTLPSDITQEATGPSGNAVTYSTSANDLVDGSVIPICTPTSGSTFLVGTTPVTCTATDSHQNTASGTFHVIIQDTTPPMITVTDINAKATGTLTPVTFSPTATDMVDGTDPVTCNSASGSTFPLGTTTVNCSSTDKHGNTSPASFTVTVAETTAPSITLPADIAQEATGPAGNVVTFSPTATDIVDGTDPVTCNPASGSTFPLGSTAVTCTSSNNAGNTATESFHVTIQDTTPPTLTIQLPANNAIVNTATVPVSGISSDNVQVSSITWKVDSGTVSTASGTTSWSFTTNTLSTGLHTIYVNATDEAGNVVKSFMSVTYVEPTVTLPPPSGGTTPITFSSSTGGFTSLDSISPSSLSPHPPPGNYPLGFFSWSITGFAPATSVTVTITSPVPLHHQSHYFKLVDGSWVSIPVSVSGNTMTMTISDNGPFDGNPAVGVISDPGAVANPTDGRVTGDGTIGKNIDFTFEVRSDIDKADNTHGTLEFHDKSGGITLHSDRISFLSVDDVISQATFSGTGDLGKNHNYIFIASIADHDKTGNHDTFSITITDNTGKVVYTNSGTVKGHIEIHKFADKDDKSDSGSKHDNNHGKNSK